VLTPTSFEEVGNPFINNLLSNKSISDIDFRAVRILSKYYLIISYGTTWSYWLDLKTRIWSSTGFSKQPLISAHIGYAIYRNPVGDGKLHYFPWIDVDQTPVYQDDGAAYSLIIQTQGLDFDTDELKTVSDIWLDADTQSSGTALLEASDDDYATWKTIGTFDMTKHEKRITRCGSHRGERAYRLTHSANTAFRAQNLRIKYTVGS
jgi:hypothetical protein